MNASDFKADPNTTIPAASLNTPEVTISASQDVVTVKSFPEAASLSQSDQKNLMLKLQLATDKNAAIWQNLTVHQEGNADVVNDVKNVSLLKEVNDAKETIATGVLNAANKTWNLSFNNEFLTTSPSTYYLAVDIGPLAVTGHEVVLALPDTQTFSLNGTADSVSPTGFGHRSDAATINQADSTMTVTGGNLALEIEEEVGAAGIPVAQLTVSVDKASVEWQKMSLLLSGNGATPSDVDKIELYENGSFFAFGVPHGNSNFFDFGLAAGYRVIVGDPKTYTLKVNLSHTAAPGDELVFSFRNGNVTVSNPATVQVGNPDGHFATVVLKVKEPTSSLRLTRWTSLTTPNVDQTSKNVEMASFTVQMADSFSGDWTSLLVNRADVARRSSGPTFPLFAFFKIPMVPAVSGTHRRSRGLRHILQQRQPARRIDISQNATPGHHAQRLYSHR